MRPFPGTRRVPGLRREELAVLAGLSPDYYSRLEQGRRPNISTASVAKRILHRDAGELHFDIEIVSPPRDLE